MTIDPRIPRGRGVLIARHGRSLMTIYGGRGEGGATAREIREPENAIAGNNLNFGLIVVVETRDSPARGRAY